LTGNSYSARRGVRTDAPSIAEIYNQGIEDRVATFEVLPRSVNDVLEWFDKGYIVTVAEQEGRIVAFAAAFPYSTRECYSGVAEFSVYVERAMRGKGAGKVTMDFLIGESASEGLWKLVSRVFPENASSRRLLKSLGFREVGTYLKHARLDGVWKDTVIVELLIEKNLA
jgi:L-amino acid N-acyltransferase YncA